MRVPRRRPRAVYEVYDAEEALGEHELPAFAEEPAEAEPAPAVARAGGAPVSAVEQVAFGAADRGPARIATEQPGRSAAGRMLAGALICAVGMCALVGIGIALLHALGGAGAVHRVGASLPLAPVGSRGHATAPLGRAAAVPRGQAAARPDAATRAEAVKPAQGVGHASAGGSIHASAAGSISGSAAGLIHASAAGSIHAPAAGSIPVSVAGDRDHPAGLSPAGPDISSELQTPWAPPAPSPGCACAAAEVEFGFER